MRMTLLMVLATVLVFGISTRADDAPKSRWKGTWSSESTGHKGPLKATIQPDGTDSYKARFTGLFAGVVPFVYSSKMQVTGVENGRVHLAADRKLPLFGQFNTRAVIDGDQFHATYQAKKDQGSFQMEKR